MKPSVLSPLFQESIFLLQQHFREPVIISGCNPSPWVLAPAQDPAWPLRTRLTSKNSNKQQSVAKLHLIDSNVKRLTVI